MGFLQRLTGKHTGGPIPPDPARGQGSAHPATLDAAVAAAEWALAQASSDSDRRDLQDQLGCSFLNRHRALGSAADLDRAISLLEVIGGPWSPGRPVDPTANHALALHRRWEARGDERDLDRAVLLMEPLLDRLSPADETVDILGAIQLLNAGLFLSHRFHLRGHLDDQDRAVELTRRSLTLLPPGHPLRLACTTNLAARHLHLFEGRGDEADAREAVRLFRTVLAMTPPAAPQRATHQANLGTALAGVGRQLRRSGRTEEAAPLNAEALTHLRAALADLGEPWAQPAATLGLGGALLEQHLLAPALGHHPRPGLEEAIGALSDAREGLNGPERIEAEVDLAHALVVRSQGATRPQAASDRDLALTLATAAAALTPLTGIRRAEINELLTVLDA